MHPLTRSVLPALAMSFAWSCAATGPTPQRLAAQPCMYTDVDASSVERIAATAVDLGQPGSLDREGLEAFGKAVGSARIVMLGEPWHGDGGAIRLRSELVRYLHQNLGFDVLVFEADFYSLHEAWARARASGDVRHAAENVYSFWGETAAAAPLWTYIAEQLQGSSPLDVAGVDTKMHGRIAREQLPSELAKRFAALEGVPASEAARAAGVLDALLNPGNAPPGLVTDESYQHLLGLVTRLERATARDEFEGQAVSSIRSNLVGEPRDSGMGANLVWLATRQYPDRKLIVWAHNNHVLTDKWAFFESPDPVVQEQTIARMSEYSIGRATYLGAVTRQFFGSRVYSVATIPYHGTYSADVAPALNGRPADFASLAALEPAPVDTLEEELARRHEVAFLDLSAFRCTPGPVRTRVLDYTRTGAVSLHIHQGYDGVLFLERTHGLNEPPFPAAP